MQSRLLSARAQINRTKKRQISVRLLRKRNRCLDRIPDSDLHRVASPKELAQTMIVDRPIHIGSLRLGKSEELFDRDTRKGDQPILEVLVLTKDWTDERKGRVHTHTLIVSGFRLRAIRGERGTPMTSHSDPPNTLDRWVAGSNPVGRANFKRSVPGTYYR
jgi:hypothetical protein